jgi:hypothetical protein
LAFSAQAKIIVVNTANNVSPAPAETNLVKAISLLDDGDTIQFSIPGPPGQVVYLQTPTGGYPIITNNNVTIDGYSQPGAAPNSNPIHAPNNAKIKICLDSRNGNATDMGNIENINGDLTQKFGFGHDEWAVIGVFRGTNFWIKGVGILSSPLSPAGSDQTTAVATIKSLAFGRDYIGSCENWHVSGCWIGVDPADGKLKYITDNSTYTNLASPGIAIAAYRHRDANASNPVYPQPGTIGVAAGSANPRAEFNVICNGYGFDSEGLNFRISGNFWGVLPDGMTSADFSTLLDGSQLGDGFIEVGRDVSNCIVGTDGDGVNDAEEGNVFGGFGNGGANMINFYSSPQTNITIAGNWFGTAVDGLTRFTNTATIVDGFGSQATVQFGSDFDGVSDALEANVVINNYPFATEFPDLAVAAEPIVFSIDPGARVSLRGNKMVNNGQVPFLFANGSGNLLNNFTNYEAAYMSTNGDIIPGIDTNNVFPHLKGTFAVGIAPYTNVSIDVYQLDQEGWINGQAFDLAELTDNNTYTNGFAQGSKYLKTFAVANTGTFDLDLSGLELGTGNVTITANYSADPPGTHRGRTQTSNFSAPATLLPGDVASVNVTRIVPDMALWYNSAVNHVTNGPINLSQIATPLGNWEPYISVMGESTFLIGFNTFADDGTLANQNFVVAKQPVSGGSPRLDYEFYDDAGNPFKGVINLSRPNGNPQRVAGDKRVGATNFITEAETSIGQVTQFQSVNRWSNNPIYQGTDRYCSEQIFSVDPSTLAQTPVTNAWDYVYGPYVAAALGANNNAPQCSRTGGRPEFLDNGNIVVMIDDKTALINDASEVTTFAIIKPDGSVVKSPTLVDPRDIWDNMTAFKGGFAIRCHNMLYFYDNNGTLQHSNDIVSSSGLSFGIGREDGSRIGSDIRSDFVYLAGQTPETSTGPVNVAIWDARTGNFVTSATVTDGDPTAFRTDRVTVAVDALNHFCVAYVYQPTTDFAKQVAARVMAFDGTNVSYLTHSFFPFLNSENNPAKILNFTTVTPSIAMTTGQICIAAKGAINSTNNPAAGPDSSVETVSYVVISNPAAGSAAPQISVSKSGANLLLSWPASAGLFTIQATSALNPTSWAPLTPQPSIVQVGQDYQATIPVGAGNSFLRLAR